MATLRAVFPPAGDKSGTQQCWANDASPETQLASGVSQMLSCEQAIGCFPDERGNQKQHYKCNRQGYSATPAATFVLLFQNAKGAEHYTARPIRNPTLPIAIETAES
jgi:hypothetical protein